MPTATPSVVVRAKNKEQTIERALHGLRDQTVEAEVILVDSGSTDRTVEIARPYCDQVISMPAEAFTYGRALNLGASTPVARSFSLCRHTACRLARIGSRSR